MTAVTVDSRFEGVPAEENVILTVSEAYTYGSKLSAVFGVQMTYIEDIDGYINCTVSGNTITFHTTGTAAKKIFCTIKGRL